MVRPSSTLGTWVRRERLLVTSLAVAAGVAALSKPLGDSSLLIVALVIAAAGAALRILIVLQEVKGEGARETAELERRSRTPLGFVQSIDPRAIGVDPAAQTVLAGGEIPDYVPRAADEMLRQAVDSALDGTGRWLVVVCGPSKVGKSRTLFEAVCGCRHHDELVLLAPVDGGSLKSFLTPDLAPRVGGNKAVLWLDDLEPFVAQGVTLDTLREWHERTRMPVLATYGGKGSDRVGDTGLAMRELTELTSSILQHAREIHLGATTSSELRSILPGLPTEARGAIDRHGLPAFLVAAPALERKLTTRRHGPGEPEAPEGAAVVRAAVDWALCGRTDPIEAKALQDLWRHYLPVGSLPTNAAFESGVRWALQPVAGNVALIQGIGSYLPYDYVVAFVRDQLDAAEPRDEAWDNAVQTGDPGQAFAVGVSAWTYDRSDRAIAAFSAARKTADSQLAAIASYDLALAHRRLGNSRAARDAYQWAIDADHPDVGPKAAAALGILLQQEGDLDGAERTFRQAIDSGHPDAAPRAGISLAILREMRGDLDGAREAFQRAIDSGHPEIAPRAVFNLAALLELQGDVEGARAAYAQALNSGYVVAERLGHGAREYLPR
jgi:tetratricopeptide (TPR) repeat protein